MFGNLLMVIISLNSVIVGWDWPLFLINSWLSMGPSRNLICLQNSIKVFLSWRIGTKPCICMVCYQLWGTANLEMSDNSSRGNCWLCLKSENLCRYSFSLKSLVTNLLDGAFCGFQINVCIYWHCSSKAWAGRIFVINWLMHVAKFNTFSSTCWRVLQLK